MPHMEQNGGGGTFTLEDQKEFMSFLESQSPQIKEAILDTFHHDTEKLYTAIQDAKAEDPENWPKIFIDNLPISDPEAERVDQPEHDDTKDNTARDTKESETASDGSSGSASYDHITDEDRADLGKIFNDDEDKMRSCYERLDKEYEGDADKISDTLKYAANWSDPTRKNAGKPQISREQMLENKVEYDRAKAKYEDVSGKYNFNNFFIISKKLELDIAAYKTGLDGANGKPASGATVAMDIRRLMNTNIIESVIEVGLYKLFNEMFPAKVDNEPKDVEKSGDTDAPDKQPGDSRGMSDKADKPEDPSGGVEQSGFSKEPIDADKAKAARVDNPEAGKYAGFDMTRESRAPTYRGTPIDNEKVWDSGNLAVIRGEYHDRKAEVDKTGTVVIPKMRLVEADGNRYLVDPFGRAAPIEVTNERAASAVTRDGFPELDVSRGKAASEILGSAAESKGVSVETLKAEYSERAKEAYVSSRITDIEKHTPYLEKAAGQLRTDVEGLKTKLESYDKRIEGLNAKIEAAKQKGESAEQLAATREETAEARAYIKADLEGKEKQLGDIENTLKNYGDAKTVKEAAGADNDTRFAAVVRAEQGVVGRGLEKPEGIPKEAQDKITDVDRIIANEAKESPNDLESKTDRGNGQDIAPGSIDQGAEAQTDKTDVPIANPDTEKGESAQATSEKAAVRPEGFSGQPGKAERGEPTARGADRGEKADVTARPAETKADMSPGEKLDAVIENYLDALHDVIGDYDPVTLDNDIHDIESAINLMEELGYDPDPAQAEKLDDMYDARDAYDSASDLQGAQFEGSAEDKARAIEDTREKLRDFGFGDETIRDIEAPLGDVDIHELAAEADYHEDIDGQITNAGVDETDNEAIHIESESPLGDARESAVDQGTLEELKVETGEDPEADIDRNQRDLDSGSDAAIAAEDEPPQQDMENQNPESQTDRPEESDVSKVADAKEEYEKDSADKDELKNEEEESAVSHDEAEPEDHFVEDTAESVIEQDNGDAASPAMDADQNQPDAQTPDANDAVVPESTEDQEPLSSGEAAEKALEADSPEETAVDVAGSVASSEKIAATREEEDDVAVIADDADAPKITIEDIKEAIHRELDEGESGTYSFTDDFYEPNKDDLNDDTVSDAFKEVIEEKGKKHDDDDSSGVLDHLLDMFNDAFSEKVDFLEDLFDALINDGFGDAADMLAEHFVDNKINELESQIERVDHLADMLERVTDHFGWEDVSPAISDFRDCLSETSDFIDNLKSALEDMFSSGVETSAQQDVDTSANLDIDVSDIQPDLNNTPDLDGMDISNQQPDFGEVDPMNTDPVDNGFDTGIDIGQAGGEEAAAEAAVDEEAITALIL